jgi:lipoprotein-anchoring transpeptidase ErfK/SrfK
MRRRWVRAATVAALTVAAAAVAALATGGPVAPPPGAGAREGAPGVPAPVAPAFTPGRPRRLGSLRGLSQWAPVERPVTARSAPSPAAPAVATVDPLTPEGTRNLVAVVERPGGAWVRVALAVLPNGTTGWVPRSALGGYGTVATHLEVDLTRLEATLYRRGRPVFHAPVGVGTPVTPTPAGAFYVRNRLTRYSSPEYGPVAFGTSARSPHATGWPAGGFVGIHGTDRPDLVPGRISHGCIRLRNEDILRLARRMPVGTPVTIR